MKKYIKTYFKSSAKTNRRYVSSEDPIVKEYLALDELMRAVIDDYVDEHDEKITKLDPNEKLYKSFIKYFSDKRSILEKGENVTDFYKNWNKPDEKQIFDEAIKHIIKFDRIELNEYFTYVKKLGNNSYANYINVSELGNLDKKFYFWSISTHVHTRCPTICSRHS